jgi:hypothetical protein
VIGEKKHTCKNFGLKIKKYVRIQVLKAASMKMIAFMNIAPCSKIEVTALMMEAVRIPETLLYFENTQLNTVGH